MPQDIFHPQPQQVKEVVINKEWEEKNEALLKQKEKEILLERLKSEEQRKSVSQMLTFEICATLIADEIREITMKQINRN